MAAAVECYSVCRLLPFEGMRQVVELEQGRALSDDGANWQLQIRGLAGPRHWGVLAAAPAEGVLLRYGVWSAREGLARLPLAPGVDRGRADATAEALLAVLGKLPTPLPFPRRDWLELWLLDGDAGLPLALLETASCGERPPVRRSAEWSASHPSDTSFVAPSLGEGARDGRPHRDVILDLVRQTAKRPPKAQWFERQADGSGRGQDGVRVPPAWLGRSLPAGSFPELLLRADWPDAAAQQLVADYHAWQAPCLLSLPGLRETTRRRLEQAASLQALRVYALHRLYPCVLDRDLLQRTLVEAVLRQASA